MQDLTPAAPAGAVAQLGERLNGIQEVGGSTPLGSTSSPQGLAANGRALCFRGRPGTGIARLRWSRGLAGPGQVWQKCNARRKNFLKFR